MGFWETYSIRRGWQAPAGPTVGIFVQKHRCGVILGHPLIMSSPASGANWPRRRSNSLKIFIGGLLLVVTSLTYMLTRPSTTFAGDDSASVAKVEQ